MMVPGGSGSGEPFRPLTEQLRDDYSIVIYDRRGFSRSRLDGPQDYDHRLHTDADDVYRLIEHVADEPPTLFGVSSGGVVALTFLARHPSSVGTVVPYEPAAMTQLPDGERWIRFFSEMYDAYRQAGIESAMATFADTTFAESDRHTISRVLNFSNDQVRANATYWFENELRQYPAAELDLEALRLHADQVVLMVGRESRGFPCYEANIELGKRLRREVIELPGGHLGFASHPAEFSSELLDALTNSRDGSRA